MQKKYKLNVQTNFNNLCSKNNLAEGTLILHLEQQKSVNSSEIYHNNQYLKSVYMFYVNNGYKNYSTIEEFSIGFNNNNSEFPIRTFLTLYKTLQECSIFPFLKSTSRYIYKSEAEKIFIGEIIEETFFNYIINFQYNLDLSKLHSLSDLRKYFKMQIKYTAHLARKIKYYNRIYTIDQPKLNNMLSTSSPEKIYFTKLNNKLMKEIIYNYLKEKDTLDSIIITNNLMRYGIPFGESNISRWTLKYIAALHTVSEKTVQNRRIIIIKELRILLSPSLVA